MERWKKKRAIMRRYDVTADIYDERYAEEQTSKIEAALKHIKMRPDANCLDAGCGTGLLFCYVADKVGNTVGADISRRSLLIAKKRAKVFQNVSLILADVDNIPLRKGIFDNVFTLTLIQNVPAPDRTLNELVRVAKHDAVFVITGLKKTFSRKAFEKLLQDADLCIVALDDEDKLKCHVAVCMRPHH